MKVFVLLGQFDYEGYYLLGVYSSRKLAVSAKVSVQGRFDSYLVEEREVDGLADDNANGPADYV